MAATIANILIAYLYQRMHEIPGLKQWNLQCITEYHKICWSYDLPFGFICFAKPEVVSQNNTVSFEHIDRCFAKPQLTLQSRSGNWRVKVSSWTIQPSPVKSFVKTDMALPNYAISCINLDIEATSCVVMLRYDFTKAEIWVVTPVLWLWKQQLFRQ